MVVYLPEEDGKNMGESRASKNLIYKMLKAKKRKKK